MNCIVENKDGENTKIRLVEKEEENKIKHLRGGVENTENEFYTNRTKVKS